MVRIARRVPTDRDMDVAALAPEMLVSQLDRLLASLPELPDPDAPPKSEPERSMEVRTGRDGWTRGRYCLPADEGALVQTGLTAARDAELRDRNDLDPDTDIHPDLPDPDPTVRRVTWAAGLVSLASAATDALDGTLQRTGNPGDRHQLVVPPRHHPRRQARSGPARVALYQELDNPWQLAGVLVELAEQEATMGRGAEALQALAESSRLGEQIGRLPGRSRRLAVAAVVHLSRGQSAMSIAALGGYDAHPPKNAGRPWSGVGGSIGWRADLVESTRAQLDPAKGADARMAAQRKRLDELIHELIIQPAMEAV